MKRTVNNFLFLFYITAAILVLLGMFLLPMPLMVILFFVLAVFAVIFEIFSHYAKDDE